MYQNPQSFFSAAVFHNCEVPFSAHDRLETHLLRFIAVKIQRFSVGAEIPGYALNSDKIQNVFNDVLLVCLYVAVNFFPHNVYLFLISDSDLFLLSFQWLSGKFR